MNNNWNHYMLLKTQLKLKQNLFKKCGKQPQNNSVEKNQHG